MNTFCGLCGELAGAGAHVRCVEHLRLEPPRYCAHCRRRMAVQVVPTGWSARCVEHGDTQPSDDVIMKELRGSMRAYAVTSSTSPDLSELELPTPIPQRAEVLLRVIRSGVCHTDIHLRDGHFDLGSRGRMRLTDTGVPYPRVMGHEVVGVVVAAGPDASDVEIGSRRLVYPWIGCGRCCVCLDGRENACARGRSIGVARLGGYVDHLLVLPRRHRGARSEPGSNDNLLGADRLQRGQ
nr:alcohol dehydrogenase [Aeromicrobium sp.]